MKRAPDFLKIFLIVLIAGTIYCALNLAQAAAKIDGSHGKPPLAVVIQPFADTPPSLADHVCRELKKVYPHVEMKTAIPMPGVAFYKPRNRYRADSLIKYLSDRAGENQVVIGLTTKDISATNGTVEDWGVMGLSYCPGKACMVSTFRLSRSDKSGQLFKVAVHELGHTQGLNHCSNLTCLMRDAEGKNTFNEEIGFCPKCRAALVDKGWKFDG